MNKAVPKNAVLGLIVAAGLIVFAAGWMLAVRPLGHQAATLRAEKAFVYRQIADSVAQRAPATATSAPKIRVADVYKLATAMPSILDMPDLLLELQQTAQAAGVQLLSISPTPAAAAAGTSGYTTEKLTLSVAGDFYGLTDLLYRLRNLVYVRGGALHANGRLFSVQNMTLSPAGTAAKNLLNANIDVDTYVYGAAAAATPAPAATTTTTSTTTTTTTSGPTAAGATP